MSRAKCSKCRQPFKKYKRLISGESIKLEKKSKGYHKTNSMYRGYYHACPAFDERNK